MTTSTLLDRVLNRWAESDKEDLVDDLRGLADDLHSMVTPYDSDGYNAQLLVDADSVYQRLEAGLVRLSEMCKAVAAS